MSHVSKAQGRVWSKLSVSVGLSPRWSRYIHTSLTAGSTSRTWLNDGVPWSEKLIVAFRRPELCVFLRETLP